MSWLFSRALVAEYSRAICSDGALSVLSSAMPTPQAFCAPDKTTDFSRPSRFGMTFAPLTESLGADVLTLFLAAFPVRTSASPGPAKDLTASARVSGAKWRASFAKFDRDTHSWKTAQCSLLADSGECSPTWPRSGSMRDGVCSERPMLALRTNATGSGLLPTLTCGGGGQTLPPGTTRTGMTPDGKKRTVSLQQALCMLPTLTVHGNHNRKGVSPTSGDGLATALRRMPTLTASDGKGGPGCSGRAGGLNLRTAIQRMPTLAASDWKGRSGAGHLSRHGAKRLSDAMPADGGPLNPTWCEWFMGFPLGWTELPDSATRKSRPSQRRRGAHCRSDAA